MVLDDQFPDAETSQHFTWIQDWLRNEATDDELRDFVEWVTGAPGVPKKGLHFSSYVDQKGHIPLVHTCSCQIVISPSKNVHPTKRGEYNTKKGFISFIKEGMMIKTLTAG